MRILHLPVNAFLQCTMRQQAVFMREGGHYWQIWLNCMRQLPMLRNRLIGLRRLAEPGADRHAQVAVRGFAGIQQGRFTPAICRCFRSQSASRRCHKPSGGCNLSRIESGAAWAFLAPFLCRNRRQNARLPLGHRRIPDGILHAQRRDVPWRDQRPCAGGKTCPPFPAHSPIRRPSGSSGRRSSHPHPHAPRSA